MAEMRERGGVVASAVSCQKMARMGEEVYGGGAIGNQRELPRTGINERREGVAVSCRKLPENKMRGWEGLP